jgi:hypothetical protein
MLPRSESSSRWLGKLVVVYSAPEKIPTFVWKPQIGQEHIGKADNSQYNRATHTGRDLNFPNLYESRLGAKSA